MNGRRHLPELPPQLKMLRLYEASATGLTQPQVAEQVKESVSNVQRWLNKPEWYSPYPDGVALDRAWSERAVYDNLSNLELHLFWCRVRKTADADTRKRLMGMLDINEHFFLEILGRTAKSPLYFGVGQVPPAHEGENNGSSKATEDLVRQIRAFHTYGFNMSEIARWFTMSASATRKIIRRETWASVA